MDSTNKPSEQVATQPSEKARSFPPLYPREIHWLFETVRRNIIRKFTDAEIVFAWDIVKNQNTLDKTKLIKVLDFFLKGGWKFEGNWLKLDVWRIAEFSETNKIYLGWAILPNEQRTIPGFKAPRIGKRKREEPPSPPSKKAKPSLDMILHKFGAQMATRVENLRRDLAKKQRNPWKDHFHEAALVNNFDLEPEVWFALWNLTRVCQVYGYLYAVSQTTTSP